MNVFAGIDGHIVLQLVAAIVPALPTAWNREVHGHALGLRTFPLVSLGACAYVLSATSSSARTTPRQWPESCKACSRASDSSAAAPFSSTTTMWLKHDNHVAGTASAASIWITGAVGAAVGFGLWGLAIVLSLLNLAVMWALGWVKHRRGD